MNFKAAALSVAAIAALAGTANADVTVNFANQTWTGWQFNEIFMPGELTGTLTGVSVDAVLDASVDFTYADDLSVYLDEVPLSTGTGLIQVGGFSNIGAIERYFWANGGSDVPGTTVIDSVTLTTPILMDGNPVSVWLGNGYGAVGTSGTWTGSVTLIGVELVPSPGAFALLGLGGLAAARRRRN